MIRNYLEEAEMPHKQFHSCDINLSLKVLGSQKRSHNGKSCIVRIGRRAGRTKGSSEHSYLYSTGSWSASEARAHCRSHGGRFIAATGKKE